MIVSYFYSINSYLSKLPSSGIFSHFHLKSNSKHIVYAKKKTEIAPLNNENIVENSIVNNKNNDVRNEALMGVLYQIEKSYGKGSIQRLGQVSSMIVETTSSGAITLDIALGGGFPKGRVVEIYGPEASGKTTLALHAIAEVQKTGGKYLIDSNMLIRYNLIEFVLVYHSNSIP